MFYYSVCIILKVVLKLSEQNHFRNIDMASYEKSQILIRNFRTKRVVQHSSKIQRVNIDVRSFLSMKNIFLY